MHEADMFRVDDLESNEVIVDVREKTGEKEISTDDPVITGGEVVTAASVKDSVAPTTATTADIDDELTLAMTLIAIKAAKPKVIKTTITTPRDKGIVFHEQVQAHIPTVSSSKDKGKAKMIEPEKPLKKKDQITLDEEVARKLEAGMRVKMKEEERMAREKYKANRVVIKESDDVHATIDADGQLAKQIQAQKIEQLSIEERSKLLAELIESRRKYFAAKRAEEIRNKPPTKAQQKKNVEESLKKTQAEGSSERAGQELEQESTKKQKLVEQEQAKVANDDTAKLKRCLEIIYKEWKKSYFKIIRDGNSQNYLTFGTMFKNFNREDLEVLRNIVKKRFKKTKPVDDMENLLFQTLKTMFEPQVEDIIWKY
uniref:Uncharacterized protein n=1 Tax=Tanacetum cinerariifolium TaxID=118510 RepID=A0A6L2LW08_TANCI|nr:hypothetical protein [Tanacetum cinerariifolium]